MSARKHRPGKHGAPADASPTSDVRTLAVVAAPAPVRLEQREDVINVRQSGNTLSAVVILPDGQRWRPSVLIAVDRVATGGRDEVRIAREEVTPLIERLRVIHAELDRLGSAAPPTGGR